MKKLSPFVRYDLPVIVRMLLPLLFILLIGVHYHEFIVSAIMANKAINMGILLTAGCGVVLIVIRLVRMQKDMSALDRFIREVQSGADMKLLLEKPWIKGKAISHYLEHLAHTEGTLASQLDQDAIQNELAALLEEYNSKMEMPQFLVGFMIAMGLLGTFIGLLETLTGISGMLDGMGHGGDIEKEFSKLVTELRKPLAGMGIAFSASMFGLVTSLMLSIMMTMLRRYTSRVMEKARSVMHRLLTRIKSHVPNEIMNMPIVGGSHVGGGVVTGSAGGFSGGHGGGGGLHADMAYMSDRADVREAVAAESKAIFAAEAAHFSDKVSEAYFKSQDAIATMANSVNLLAKRMDAITKSLEANIETTQKTNSLLNFGPRMAEANEQIVSEIRILSSAQEDSQKIMQKIIGSLIQIDQSLMANSTKDVVVAQRESTATLNEMFGNEQSQIRLVSELLESQREGNRDLLQALKGMQDRMVRQDEVTLDSSRHLFEIKESFARAMSSFALVDTVAENIGRQTLLVEASLAEERNTQKSMIQSIQRELRDFTDTLRQFLDVSSPT